MSNLVDVLVPDIGNFDSVDVIEVLVKVGDELALEDSLITVESDKASMDIPSPVAGIVKSVTVKVGDKVAKDSLLMQVESQAQAAKPAPAAPAKAEAPAKSEPAPAPAAAPQAAAPVSAAPLASTNAVPASDVHAEVVVLGSGPGGYTAAFRAADLGKKVVLIERYATLGGVCLNVGCIPSKALLHTAKVITEAEETSQHGVSFSAPNIDLEQLRHWKANDVVGKLTAGSQATKFPGAPADERIMDSTGALALADIPKRLLVIGGGIIGLEMGTVYDALGSKVSVVEFTDGLVQGCDRDLVRPLQKRMEKRFESIMLSTKVVSMDAKADGIHVSFEGEAAPKDVQVYDRVLVSIGRKPNGKNIGAELAGVNINDWGFIPVDKQMRTNVPHIFAIGDIVGQPMLAHKATHEGKVAAEVIAGHKVQFQAMTIPSVAYTDPEIAWAGVTETEAKAQGIDYEKASFPWAASGRALSVGRTEGTTKLIFDKTSHRLIGAGIVGVNAGELLAETVLAIEMGADAHDLGLTIHPHPTLSETVCFAAEMKEGTITDLYIKKR